MSQMAYGSSTSYGPACGKCFKLTLLNTFLSNPPFIRRSQSRSSSKWRIYALSLKMAGVMLQCKKTNPCASKAIILTYSHTNWQYPSEAATILILTLYGLPSAIPDDFFPSKRVFLRWALVLRKHYRKLNACVLGYTVSYTCSGRHKQSWYNKDSTSGFRCLEYLVWDCHLPVQLAGWKDAAALGNVTAQEGGGCCPADPTVYFCFPVHVVVSDIRCF